MERRDSKYGSTILLQFVYYATDTEESRHVVEVMLDNGRCQRHAVNYFGMGVLHAACFNQNSVPGIVDFLIEADADVNKQMEPQTDEWRKEYHDAQQAVLEKNVDEVSREVASWEKSTPLMLAARR